MNWKKNIKKGGILIWGSASAHFAFIVRRVRDGYRAAGAGRRS